jgi:hypothetical protein
MPAEFIDLLAISELDIGHSKIALFTSDHFHNRRLCEVSKELGN